MRNRVKRFSQFILEDLGTGDEFEVPGFKAYELIKDGIETVDPDQALEKVLAGLHTIKNIQDYEDCRLAAEEELDRIEEITGSRLISRWINIELGTPEGPGGMRWGLEFEEYLSQFNPDEKKWTY